MQDSWQQVKHIFLGALERPANERSAFVHDAAGADPIVLAEVESLLQSEESSGSFLEQPPAPLLGAVAVDVPLRIGPYRVVREIGHGGMGAVYLAVRDDDTYAKQVAIKMIGAPAVTALAIERFRHERQILANLDHPNIARLLDGGATPAGLPYVVIEYVDGVPIDQFVADRRLPIPDRLRLFVDVCGAVQYAHQRLVVHRDLKPGNILIELGGIPKLLDFGISKLLQGGPVSTSETIASLLTPDYASPEQIRGDAITPA